MSKKSKQKAIKRKRRERKKKQQTVCGEVDDSGKKLRFIAYMIEDDARDFSGVLCRLDNKNLISAKYSTLHSTMFLDDIRHTRIALYVHDDNVYDVNLLIEDCALTSINSRYFLSTTCEPFYKAEISDDNLCIVGTILHEEVDQFKGDLKFSRSIDYVEVIFHQVPNNHRNVIVEIYADGINCESIIELLEVGWMSDRWSDQFHRC